MCGMPDHPLQQIIRQQSIRSLKRDAASRLLRHKCIDFCQVVFHNIVTAELLPQQLQPVQTERSPRAVGDRTFWKHGGGSLSIFPYKETQGSLLTRCYVVTKS